MDEEQPITFTSDPVTSTTVTGPTTTNETVNGSAVEPKRGRILATYLVRVTLRELAEPFEASDEEPDKEPDIPTNVLMAQIVEEGIYESTVYFAREQINATSERV